MGLHLEMLRQSIDIGTSATSLGGLHRCLCNILHPGHQRDRFLQQPQLLVHPFGSGGRILPRDYHLHEDSGHRKWGGLRVLHDCLRRRLVRGHAPQVHLTQRREEGDDTFLQIRSDRAAISGASTFNICLVWNDETPIQMNPLSYCRAMTWLCLFHGSWSSYLERSFRSSERPRETPSQQRASGLDCEYIV